MILTVVLSPSIEKVVVVDGIEINNVNQIEDYRLNIGPSGIYSAIIVKILQGEPYVIGFAGGIGGRYIKNFMDKNKIKSDIIWKDKETRSILNIIDSINMTETKFIDQTFTYDEKDIKNIKNRFNNYVKNSKVTILNDGNINDNKTLEIIKTLLCCGKTNNNKIIISLFGEHLRHSLEYNPFGIILQNSDLQELEIDNNLEIDKIIKKLKNIIIDYKVRYLVYDDGNNVFILSKNKICSLNYRLFMEDKENYVNKDVLAGGLAICAERNYEMEKTIKLLGSVIVSTNLDNYPNVINRKDIDYYMKKLKVKEIYNKKKGYCNGKWENVK